MMAKLLSRSAKQFRADVKKYEIPHLKLGRDRLFDPNEVEQVLLVRQSAQSNASATQEKPATISHQKAVYKTQSNAKDEQDATTRYELLLGLR